MADRKVMGLALAVLAGSVLVMNGAAQAGPVSEDCGIGDGSPSPFAGGDGYPGNPYQIAIATQLAVITGDFLDCDFIQTANISLSGEWTPIGSDIDLFRGVYDGDGFTISGLSITGTNDYVGLFGAIGLAEIKNVTLTNVSVVGVQYVGGLVGSAQGTLITNVTVSGTVRGALRVGGIAGELLGIFEGPRSSLTDSSSNVTITAIAEPLVSSFGGAVGYLEASDMSQVSASGSVSGTNEVGGLVGYGGSESAISYSRATGAVSGELSVGGAVGVLSYSQIFDSYATGSVTASGNVAGGIVGSFVSSEVFPSSMARSYAVGVVTADEFAGGLVGYLDAFGRIIDSYWNDDANVSLNGIGLNESAITTVDPPGSTLVQLRNHATYANWAITNGWASFVPTAFVWGICDDVATPYLLWEETESPCADGWTVDGFFSPVDMDGIINVATAGRVVPLKWRLSNEAAAGISDPNSFSSITTLIASCITSSVVVQDVVESYAGGSGLRYLGDGYWQFNWATPKIYAHQCGTVTLTLSDGSTLSAKFRFRR